MEAITLFITSRGPPWKNPDPSKVAPAIQVQTSPLEVWSENFQVDVLRHAENNPPAFTNRWNAIVRTQMESEETSVFFSKSSSFVTCSALLSCFLPCKNCPNRMVTFHRPQRSRSPFLLANPTIFVDATFMAGQPIPVTYPERNKALLRAH